jgi:hypothetical protein
MAIKIKCKNKAKIKPQPMADIRRQNRPLSYIEEAVDRENPRDHIDILAHIKNTLRLIDIFFICGKRFIHA